MWNFKKAGPTPLALVLCLCGPVLAMAAQTVWFNVSMPCVTIFGVTLHWTTALILVLLFCGCCTPCCAICIAMGIQRQAAQKAAGSSGGGGFALVPTEDVDPEESALMRGYGDVFPMELQRAAEAVAKAAGPKRPSSLGQMLPACAYCCFFLLLLVGMLVAPLASWTTYKLYDTSMVYMSYPSPTLLWIGLLVIGSLTCMCQSSSCFIKTNMNAKQCAGSSGSCLGFFLLPLLIWAYYAAPTSQPFLAREVNAICRDFENAATRPANCPAAVATTPRRLFTNASNSLVRDIDLDEDGQIANARKLDADPAHDGAASYLQRLMAGGSYCVDTSQNSKAWVAPAFDQRSHYGKERYFKELTTTCATAGQACTDACTETTELCKKRKEFTDTSCHCSGETVTDPDSKKEKGGYCNLWNFGDQHAWCYISANADATCTQLIATNGKRRSAAPCDNTISGQKVVMRSEALVTGYYQFVAVIVLGTLMCCCQCCTSCYNSYANRKPLERRYHLDNGLPWEELRVGKPQNCKAWEVLGWNAESWDADDPALYPASEGKRWAQLGQKPKGGRFDISEQQAAANLGFTAVSWDNHFKRMGAAEEDALETAARTGAASADDHVDTDVVDKFYAWAEEASKRVTQETPENKRLEIYGYYHQALQGNVTGLRPERSGGPDEQKKYDAWYRLTGMSRSMAMQKYITAVKELPLPPGKTQSSWGKP